MIWCLVLGIFVVLPSEAKAGVIIQRPLYIGLTNGLVGYWSFDAPDMAGVAAYDRSGNNNTGTLTNGPTRQIGKIGQALSFDGSDDRVAMGSAGPLGGNPRTVSAWIKSSKTSNQVILDYGAQVSAQEFQFVVGNGTLGLAISGANIFYTASGINNGTWHHISVMVPSNATLNDAAFYLDGVKLTTINSSSNPTTALDTVSTTAIRVGASIVSTQFFNGLIDDVRIYNRALSPDEIKRLYNMGATTKFNVSKKQDPSLNQGLVGLWTFDAPDMAGVAAYDRSGQGNHGTLTNGPTRAIGKIGQALNFDGNDDKVDALSPTSFDDLGPMTASAWVYTRGPGRNNGGAIFIKGSGATSGDGSWNLNIASTNFALDFLKDYATVNLHRRSANNALVKNTWQHVLVTWDGSATAANVKIYINGIEVSYQLTQDGTGDKNSDAARNLYIGNSLPGSLTFDGLIDEVRVYNRALAPDEIKRLYNMGATTKFNVSKKQDPSLNQGLVGLWTFDAPDMAGVAAYDRSGNNNTGTLTNGPTRAIGKIGQALNFDGVNDWVSVGNPAALNDLGAITLSVWAKQNSLGYILTKGSCLDSDSGWCFASAGTNYYILYRFSGGTHMQTVTSNNTVSLGVWKHIVVTSDSSGLSANTHIYIDGVETTYQAPTNVATPLDSDSTMPFQIGSRIFGIAPNSGSFDEVRIYNRALSPDEIKRLYNMGR